MTAFWELQLEQVTTGQMTSEQFLTKQVNFVTSLVTEVQTNAVSLKSLGNSIPDCPKCKTAKLKQITSKKSGDKFWVCASDREACDAIFSDKSGKPDFSNKKKNTAKSKTKAA